VNPARSTGVAVFVGDWAISQLWLFWVAPIAGGLLGAVIHRFIGSERSQSRAGLNRPAVTAAGCPRKGKGYPATTVP
jgi:aquaporin Z